MQYLVSLPCKDYSKTAITIPVRKGEGKEGLPKI